MRPVENFDAFRRQHANVAHSGVPDVQLRVDRIANDNHSIHAPWRRFVAASMAVLFAASLILVGLACIANAAPIIP